MVYLLIAVIVVLFLFGVNYFYTEVVLRDSQVNAIVKAKKGHWDIVALGSTMCKYAFDFTDSGAKGFNFGYAAQFFYYTDLTLRSYSQYFNKGCWVVIICPDLVFAEPGKGVYYSPQMMKMLSKELLADEYNTLQYIKDVKFPIVFHPALLLYVIRYIVKSKQKSDLNIAFNPLDTEGMKKSAESIYSSWDKNFHIEQMASNNRPPEIERKISQSRDLLTGILQYCADKGFRPVLTVPPISKELDEYIYIYREKILYENIKIANKQKVPVFDYLHDERLKDGSLYLNSFKLNATGRKKMTEILLSDIKKIEMKNGQ